MVAICSRLPFYRVGPRLMEDLPGGREAGQGYSLEQREDHVQMDLPHWMLR